MNIDKEIQKRLKAQSKILNKSKRSRKVNSRDSYLYRGELPMTHFTRKTIASIKRMIFDLRFQIASPQTQQNQTYSSLLTSTPQLKLGDLRLSR